MDLGGFGVKGLELKFWSLGLGIESLGFGVLHVQAMMLGGCT